MNTNFPHQFKNRYNSCCDSKEKNMMNESQIHQRHRCHPFFVSSASPSPIRRRSHPFFSWSVPNSPIRRPVRRQSNDVNCLNGFFNNRDHFNDHDNDKNISSSSLFSPPIEYISFYNDDGIPTTPDLPPKYPIRLTSESDDNDQGSEMNTKAKNE